MTIAACYVSTEGVVFGADSTTTLVVADPDTHKPEQHFFDFGQKVFELGEKDATLGVVTWGLGTLPSVSYRTLFAELADELKIDKPASVEDVAKRWIGRFWSSYDTMVRTPYRQRLEKAQTEEERLSLRGLAESSSVGFCVGGVALPNRRPAAYEILFAVDSDGPPTAKQIANGQGIFRGAQSLLERMLFGIDPRLFEAIVASDCWKGTDEDLANIVGPFVLGQPSRLPMREAIDWIYSSIQGTIKGIKFSPFARLCGGPIEIAVVTSDRPFRWVRHKSLDAALREPVSETHPEAV